MTMHAAGGGWGPGGQGGYGPPGGPPPGGYGPPGGPPPGGYGPPGGPPPGGYGPPGGPPGGFGGPSHGPFVPPGPGFGPPKQGTSAALIIGLVLGGLGLFVVALGAVGAWLFWGVSRAPAPVAASATAPAPLPAKIGSKAHRHVPTGCELVLRLDLAKVIEAPAMKKHLVPVLDDLEANAENDDAGKDFKEFFQTAGIDPKADMKDAVMCMVGLDKPDDQQKFVLIIGGELRPESVVPAFEAVEFPKPTLSVFEGRKVATGKDKDGGPIIMGQGGDGAIVFGTDRALFESAVKDSTTYQSEYALPTETEASMFVSKAFIQTVMEKGGGPNNPLSRDVSAISRVIGTLTLANPRGELRIGMASAKDAVRFNQTIVGVLLPGFRRQTAGEKSQAGELEALKAAKSRVDGSDIVLEVPWTADGVEQAARLLAAELKKARSGGIRL